MVQNSELKITGLFNALNVRAVKPVKQLEACKKLVELLINNQIDFIKQKGYQDLSAFEDSPIYKTFYEWSSTPLLDSSKLHEYALEKHQSWDEVACPDLIYGLSRLVSGLASNHSQVRSSFATCLTAVLRKIPHYIPLRVIMYAMFFKLGVSPLGPHETNNSHDWLLGRICLLVSCIRAKLFSEISNPSLLKALLSHILYECMPAKSYLSLGFANVFVDIILQVPFDFLKEPSFTDLLFATEIKTLDHFYVILASFSIFSKKNQAFPSQTVLIQACMDEAIYGSIGFHRDTPQIHPIFKYLISFLLSTSIDIFRSFWEKIILSDFILSKSHGKNFSALHITLHIMEDCCRLSSERASEVISICWGLKGKAQKHHNLLHRLFRETISFKESVLKAVATEILASIFLMAEKLPKDACRTFTLAMEQNRTFWTIQPSAASKLWKSLFTNLLITSSSSDDLSQLINGLLLDLDSEKIILNELNHKLKFIFGFLIQNKKSLEKSSLHSLIMELWNCILKVLSHNSIEVEAKYECFNRFKQLLSSVFLLSSMSHKSLEYCSSEKELLINIGLINSLNACLLKSFDSLSTIKLKKIHVPLTSSKLLSISLFNSCLKLLYYVSVALYPSRDHQQLFDMINDLASLLNNSESKKIDQLRIPLVDQLVDIVLASLSIEFSLLEGPIYVTIICWKENFAASSVDLLVQALTSPLDEIEDEYSDGENFDSDNYDDAVSEGLNSDDYTDQNVPVDNSSSPSIVSNSPFLTVLPVNSSFGGSECSDIPLESISDEQMEIFDASLKNISFLLRKNSNEKQLLKKSLAFYSRVFSILSFVLNYCSSEVFATFLETIPLIHAWLGSLSKFSKDTSIVEFKKRILSQIAKWKPKAK
ncbi:hypothetical protein DI09_26p10 [Mitosporidium daphniae]|uniref:Uncharacterized protein n=1 Tax=Mitosporidium daphniae TaxID=1485682 RepID=A0A098VVP9_9MICR|nr:uncharacterized protein DI09_26p10 [Mitosporidium daphniae]KGG51801.1 hypothetical protein DI09_26p10 [Mitosporidium daphniae]|eukprot:XP_013238257.1 uncharacterized protein DI09_26p10 [Mitosporidium daphniae]